MAPLDALTALPDIGVEDPVGPNLEFDPDFAELDRVVQGKPEQQYGALVVPAEEPDWKDALAKALALSARTYDLRVMAHIAVSRLHLHGVTGFAAAVAMIREVLEGRWAGVHPQLDPEDDNDPTVRSNALLRLAEAGRVLRVLRDAPLARSSRAGAVSWRDIAIAAGTIEADPGKPKVNEASIVAAFHETDAGALATLRDAVGSLVADVAAIPAVFDREAGYGTGPELGDLGKLLKEIGRAIDKYAPAPDATAEPGEEPLPDPTEEGPAPRRSAVATAASLGAVTNRADAVRLLDLVIQYYELHEPSSPLPLLIGRARRLADKSFIDLMRDLAPDGISQVEIIAGRPQE